MAELPVCILCKCSANVEVAGDGNFAFHYNNHCPWAGARMREEQWTKLMGQGDAVGVVREFHVDWHKQSPPQGTQLYISPPEHKAHTLGPSLLEQSDLDFISARLGRVARRVGYQMPDGDAQFIVSVSGSILGGIDHAIQLLQQQAPAVDDGVVRDAARYRWLREQHKKHLGLTICAVGMFELTPWSGDDPDRAIDNAIKKEQQDAKSDR